MCIRDRVSTQSTGRELEVFSGVGGTREGGVAAMPAYELNYECFYRHHNGEEHSVNFAEELYYKGGKGLAAAYGGDGTLGGTAEAFYHSLGEVSAKRLVRWESGGHQTVASDGISWDSLPAECAEGAYLAKTVGMEARPRWAEFDLASKESAVGAFDPVEEEGDDNQELRRHVVFQRTQHLNRVGRPVEQVGF
eukprot:TRINITY_DN15918_c0_g1_i2.p1 TRINITY_DN15918_c0_g1~~TRINITY_DN15918_c0_g1_i2.p1  ORF type:complete len:193 (+),score=38.22 TRINITY_DN15918_c0_g1_i2:121-699(+)